MRGHQERPGLAPIEREPVDVMDLDGFELG
jgi:hypothetical protein